jgi:hypothetical protein
MPASFAGSTDVTGQAVASRRVRPRRADSSPMPMRQRALNLEGDCHVPYTRRLRLEARPLRVAPQHRRAGGHRGRASGARTGPSSANPPVICAAQPQTTRISGPACHLTSSQAGPFTSKAKGGAMPKSSRYSITELPGTLQRSCREAQQTFLSALEDDTDPRGGRSSSPDRLPGAEAELRETRRSLDCQGQARGQRRGRASRSACRPREQRRAADPAVGVVTRVLGRRHVPHPGTLPRVPEVRYQITRWPGFARVSGGSPAAASAGTASRGSARPCGAVCRGPWRASCSARVK